MSARASRLAVSAIIPVHNEAETLADAVARLSEALRRFGWESEIIICEDGSTDGSAKAARAIAAENPGVRAIISEKRLGRGLSLSRAIRGAKGDIVIYMDADLATGLAHLPELVRAIEAGAGIATGSRMLPGSIVEGRSALREISSRGYNLLIRILFGSRIHDHQCGFKAFRKSGVLPLLEEVRDRHWFWDTELLVRAQRKGMRVAEIPVRWKDRKESRVRLHSDIFRMGASALMLRLALWKGVKRNRGD